MQRSIDHNPLLLDALATLLELVPSVYLEPSASQHPGIQYAVEHIAQAQFTQPQYSITKMHYANLTTDQNIDQAPRIHQPTSTLPSQQRLRDQAEKLLLNATHSGFGPASNTKEPSAPDQTDDMPNLEDLSDQDSVSSLDKYDLSSSDDGFDWSKHVMQGRKFGKSTMTAKLVMEMLNISITSSVPKGRRSSAICIVQDEVTGAQCSALRGQHPQLIVNDEQPSLSAEERQVLKVPLIPMLISPHVSATEEAIEAMKREFIEINDKCSDIVGPITDQQRTLFNKLESLKERLYREGVYYVDGIIVNPYSRRLVEALETQHAETCSSNTEVPTPTLYDELPSTMDIVD